MVRNRLLKFSYWPMSRTTRRYGLQNNLFVQNPWTIISSSINRRCPTGARAEALAYLQQAQDFYTAATSERIVSAKPLLLYYCFMNIAKSYCLTVGTKASLNQAQHGLSERLTPGADELRGAYLEAHRSSASTINIFDEFYRALTGHPISAKKVRYDIPVLLPQIVAGHRLWVAAANGRERFLSIDWIHILEETASKSIWLTLRFLQEDLNRLGLTHRKLLLESRLQTSFRDVKDPRGEPSKVYFEQRQSITYTHIAADEIQDMVAAFRKNLWAVVTSLPPYRKYYVYCCSPTEATQVLPQIASIYAMAYYLGSITRYRPHHFDKIVRSPYGPFVEEFISSQPTQFMYLMASDFATQEIIKPAIV